MLHKNEQPRSVVLFFQKMVGFLVGRFKPAPKTGRALLAQAILAQQNGDSKAAEKFFHDYVVERARQINFDICGGKRPMDYL